MENVLRSKQDNINKSLYITVDGGDFCGKTTLINNIQNELVERGVEKDIVYIKEPFLNDFIEPYIEKLKNNRANETTALEVAMAMTVSRLKYTQPLLHKYMSEDKIIIQDRSWISTLIYQGITDELQNIILSINTSVIKPDIAFVMWVSHDSIIKRMSLDPDRRIDEIDSDLTFQKQINSRILNLHYSVGGFTFIPSDTFESDLDIAIKKIEYLRSDLLK